MNTELHVIPVYYKLKAYWINNQIIKDNKKVGP